MIQRCRHCGVCTGGLIHHRQEETQEGILWPAFDCCPACISLINEPSEEERTINEKIEQAVWEWKKQQISR